MATGIAGLSVAADSLSAIKYATVKAVRNEEGLIVDFKTEGEFPCYGNNDAARGRNRMQPGQQLHGKAAQASHLPQLPAHPAPS